MVTDRDTILFPSFNSVRLLPLRGGDPTPLRRGGLDVHCSNREIKLSTLSAAQLKIYPPITRITEGVHRRYLNIK